MRGLTSTLVLVVVLAGLGGYIYFVDSKRPAASADGSPATKEKVFTVEADKINELRITYQGETSLLKKSDAGWKMIEPAQIDADPPEAIGVATAITQRRDRPRRRRERRPTSSSSASPTRRSRSHSRPTAARRER